jgi:hypothetical protein
MSDVSRLNFLWRHFVWREIEPARLRSTINKPWRQQRRSTLNNAEKVRKEKIDG